MEPKETRLPEEQIRVLCKERKLTVAAAESCTGGALSACLTAIPGASTYFLGSIISYSNFAKIKLLDVPETLLIEFGAVSKITAEKMLVGVLQKLSPSIAVAITGLAGPEGGTVDLPIGTVYVAIGGKAFAFKVYELKLTGNRQEIIQQTVNFVLKKLIEILTQ